MPFPKPPSRARVKAARKRLISKRDRVVYLAVWSRDQGRCRRCGEAGDHFGLHCHHIIFRSHGGGTTLENVCLLCPSHHDDVHAGRLRITGSAEGELLFERNREVSNAV